ncbi:bifunctional 3-(3-hydroxy-phenyl)propionate/3-hydroxycinnamic acid hydroxylase [Paraburkholderia sp. Ac-20342]|uniref:bifunctional 3-(3-hydroxy-phenyl)propionate/3-hydroxycinnamic acid hydroxylase n=1 Tax=Paraburkholderia sp. Ac-20342 TaxID=2703889 RepID=UPI0019811787|nr:bifunctional 3-(3-hydroxy-phenyl)propionate/3-hydroxycinnamic acid hydroxylase [Paraburkholderia sp. Ac-20342]MBN3845886.1 bifunctional 3-(3-hydroxy-phenyl)propionate/3-hydroxycinnamic acid hydroxylase [Paraburkholderia sp. Ac-20342]
MKIIDTDVLVVGGGPTGLTLSNVLGRAGARFVLVDRKPSTIGEPRAVSIDDESLRTMQAVGLSEAVMKDVVPGYGVHYFTRHGGRCFGKVIPTASEYGFPRRNAFRQPLFEATVRDGLNRFASGQVLFGHTLESLEQGERGVTARVSAAGEEIEIRAKYLVACDGGRSPIREMLGIRMVGSTFKSRWLVIDTEDDDDTFSQMRVYCDAGRAVVDVPGPHRTRRFEILVHPDESAEAIMEPATVRKLLMPFRGDRETNIIRKTVYTFHARVAERWQEGRVFLAGDAAHLTPPYAGQGMNSGVRDAFNLGWKLAAVLDGRLPERVLDSYETERRGHAWALIRLALNLGIVMAPSSRLSAFLWQAFFTFAAYVPPLRDYFLQMKFKPKPRFREGLLGPDDGLGKRSFRGRMLPQPMVRTPDGMKVLLDDLTGQGFSLVQYGPVGGSRLADLGHPLWNSLRCTRVHVLPAGSSMPVGQNRGSLQFVVDENDVFKVPLGGCVGQILLLRPDRYVAGAFRAEEQSQFATAYAVQLSINQPGECAPESRKVTEVATSPHV